MLLLFAVGLSADEFAELEGHGLGDGIDHPDAVFLLQKRAGLMHSFEMFGNDGLAHAALMCGSGQRAEKARGILAVILKEVLRVPLVLTRSHSLFFILGLSFGSLLQAYEIQLKVPGVADDVLVSFPENHDPAKSWPVVFSYHGFNAKPE